MFGKLPLWEWLVLKEPAEANMVRVSTSTWEWGRWWRNLRRRKQRSKRRSKTRRKMRRRERRRKRESKRKVRRRSWGYTGFLSPLHLVLVI